ncbi:TfoX/Sxy family protein [Pseudarthrobacter sp. NamB4]|nr:TfoX/Sxy family protein [Pseudarthrobacter sp. NamB4]
MFGGLSFMVDDRMVVAAGRDGGLLVPTNPAAHQALLDRGGRPAYMGRDRPMGPGWITVPHEKLRDAAALAFWLQVGIDSRDTSH